MNEAHFATAARISKSFRAALDADCVEMNEGGRQADEAVFMAETFHWLNSRLGGQPMADSSAGAINEQPQLVDGDSLGTRGAVG